MAIFDIQMAIFQRVRLAPNGEMLGVCKTNNYQYSLAHRIKPDNYHKKSQYFPLDGNLAKRLPGSGVPVLWCECHGGTAVILHYITSSHWLALVVRLAIIRAARDGQCSLCVEILFLILNQVCVRPGA